MQGTRLVTGDARLVDAATKQSVAGRELVVRVDAAARELAHGAGAVFVQLPSRLDAVIGYLGALAAGRPVCPLDPEAPPVMLHELVERFAPALVAGAGGAPPDGYAAIAYAGRPAWLRQRPAPHAPHPELALLLATSGSTGRPRLVRLSGAAVQASARAIARALAIAPADVAVTSLPLFYSYGLSVLHSHLVCGATVVLEERTLMHRTFWRDVAEHGVTSLAAVPYQYQVLRRMAFQPADHPTLRTLTQAGGRLAPELIAEFHARMTAAGGRLFVMYGQTEAGPRMTTLPSSSLPAKLGSVGPAIPGGTLAIGGDAGETSDPGVTGEVIYRGPNVMMGYAEAAADLARADEHGGRLCTGDLGYLDRDGCLWLTGRRTRMCKVFGVRIHLDDVERLLAGYPPAAALAGDDRLVVFVETADPECPGKLAAMLAGALRLHPRGFDVRRVEQLPLLPSGKVDYRALERAI